MQNPAAYVLFDVTRPVHQGRHCLTQRFRAAEARIRCLTAKDICDQVTGGSRIYTPVGDQQRAAAA